MQVKEKVPKDSQKSRRRKYSDGIKGHSEKLSSVNRTMIIGIMPSAQEFHDNLSVIFKILELSKIPDCSISADLKLGLDCCGKGSASSKHPCPICDISTPLSSHKTGKLLTVGDLRKGYQMFMEAGGDKGVAKEFKNIINEDLFFGWDDATLVIDILNIPELHILLGVGSKMLDFFDKLLGVDFVDKFLATLNITRNEWHGKKSLNGNPCKILCSRIMEFKDHLENIDEESSDKALAGIEVLSSFNEVSTK